MKKFALGKGIASLIQETPNAVIAKGFDEQVMTKDEGKLAARTLDAGPALIDILSIKTNPNQPRKIFKERELEELANSIKENGIIQPLIVAKTNEGFELVAGERRLRAAKRAGLEKVPVVIKYVTDKEKMVMAIIENIQRSDLNCIEEALAYYQLMEDFKLTQEEVAKKLGKERSSVANYLRVLKLPRPVIELLKEEILTFGHAKLLASAKDIEETIRFANMAASKNLTVRELEELMKKSNASTRSQSRKNNFFDEKLDQLKSKLEQQTGFHFSIVSKNNGSGNFVIKFNNEAEFNDIFEYLARPR